FRSMPVFSLFSGRIARIEHREPHGRSTRVGPVDPVAAMRSDIQAVAAPEYPRLALVFKAQPCGAGKHHYPFRFRLVIPKTRRTCLTPRNDPLDAQAGPG